jgi:hypothetical protein
LFYFSNINAHILKSIAGYKGDGSCYNTYLTENDLLHNISKLGISNDSISFTKTYIVVEQVQVDFMYFLNTDYDHKIHALFGSNRFTYELFSS